MCWNQRSYSTIAWSSEGCERTSLIIADQAMSLGVDTWGRVAWGGFVRTIFAVMSASICMIADDSDLAALVLSSRRALNMDEEDDS